MWAMLQSDTKVFFLSHPDFHLHTQTLVKDVVKVFEKAKHGTFMDLIS